jgi:hypothetical protein
VFANRLNNSENPLQRGFSELFKSDVFRRLRQENSPQYAFRRVAKPVFVTPVYPDEQQAYSAPPQPAPPSQQQYHSTPTPPSAAPPVDDVPLANRIKAMEWQRRQQNAVAQVNASLPSDCHVAAHTILPAELFNGEIGRFLMIACDFYSHGLANTLLLPSMPAGALHFKLPQHPNATSEAQKSEARARVIQLRTRVANEHNRIAAALERGDVELLFKPNSNRPDYKQELASICKSIAINALGLSAFVTHESRFSDALGGARV